MLIGDSEIIQPLSNHHSKLNRQSRIVKYYGFMTIMLNNLVNSFNNLVNLNNRRRAHSQSLLITFMKNLETKLEHFLGYLSKTYNYKHRMCAHRYNCFIYPIVVRYYMKFAIKKIILHCFNLGIRATIYSRLFIASRNQMPWVNSTHFQKSQNFIQHTQKSSKPRAWNVFWELCSNF